MSGNRVIGGRRVAILAPISVSGESGGAERLYAGLHAALRQQECVADLIPVPHDESTFERILDGYERCRAMDLSAYDLVISTKSPTYNIRHPRHVAYLVHTVRVFYDRFDATFPAATPELLEQRRLIHRLDTEALATAARRFAIGHEVASRLRRFNRLDAKVLHPPLGSDRFLPQRAENFFFLPGRLHPWKRVDLLIRAVRASPQPLRLLIAGTGEAEAELRSLAAGDPRIEFLGRIGDEQLVDLYGRCLAVPFVPVHEDYGYVTLEAFASGTPVITCTDSGETVQFVAHGQTGWVCDPTPGSIRDAMEACLRNRTAAATMGERCRQVAASQLAWPAVASRLLADPSKPREAVHPAGARGPSGRVKVAVLDMQPITPAVGGGRLRLLGLYHALGDDFKTRYVGSYDWPGERLRRQQLTTTLEELVVPLSDDHHAAARRLSEAAGGKTVIDIAFPRLGHLSAEYLRAAREAVDWGDVVVFSHPWVYPLVAERVRLSQLVVYDSQNVEGFLRAQLLDAASPTERQLLREVLAAEYRLGLRADLVLVCSNEDRARYGRLYEWPEEKLRIVPNGVMSRQIVPASPTERAESRRRLGIDRNARVAIFLGSSYGPNLEAARFIADVLAPALPDLTFAIVGGVGDHLQRAVPPNVAVTGFVDDDTMLRWLQAADLAVNPMFSGSGTNIKMFHFMAAGLPVVTSPIGARGIEGEDARGLRIVDGEAEAFVAALREVAADEALRLSLGGQGRATVEERFAWDAISPRIGELLRLALRDHQAGRERGRLVALLSTWNVKCGIAEHASHLAGALHEAGCDVVVLGNELPDAGAVSPIPEMLMPCVRVWSWDNVTWSASRIDLDKLGRVLRRCQPDLLLIQHHTGFLGTADYAAVLQLAAEVGLPVLVEAHNARELACRGVKQWPGGGKVRLWVHDEEERKLLRRLTAIAVLTQPLPVPVPRSRTEARSRPAAAADGPVLGGFGFLRPYKGVTRAIRIVAALKARYPGARYTGYHAAYDADESGRYLQECLDEARRLGVSDSVQIDTAFLPIDEVIARLSSVDAIVLPYEPSAEGASATASAAVAAGRPILTSASLIFKPLKEVAIVVDNQEPGVWADAVRRLLENPDLALEQEARVRRWAAQHSYENAAAKVLALADELRYGRRFRTGQSYTSAAGPPSQLPATGEVSGRECEASTTRVLGRVQDLLCAQFRDLLREYEPIHLGRRPNPVDLVFAYRQLLGRMPLDPSELDQLLTWTGTWREFLQQLLASAEYRHQLGFLPAGLRLMSEANGFRFWFASEDREMGAKMAAGAYEPATVSLLSRLVRPTMRCLDIGAQTGYYTCHLARLVGSSGRVFSFEPMRQSFELLRQNVAENGWNERVRLYNVACADVGGRIEAAVASGMVVAAKGGESVESLRIDDLDLTPIDFCKIDVEGFEPRVVQGMREVLVHSKPLLVTEVNEYWLQKGGTSSKAYCELLTRFGYRLFDIDDGLREVVAEAQRDGLANINVLALPLHRVEEVLGAR